MTDTTGLYVASWIERVHQGESVHVTPRVDLYTEHGWVLAGESALAFAAYYSGGNDWVRLILPGGAELSTTMDVLVEDKTGY